MLCFLKTSKIRFCGSSSIHQIISLGLLPFKLFFLLFEIFLQVSETLMRCMLFKIFPGLFLLTGFALEVY